MSDPTDKQDQGGRNKDQTIRLAELYEKMSGVLRENLERAGMITESRRELWFGFLIYVDSKHDFNWQLHPMGNRYGDSGSDFS